MKELFVTLIRIFFSGVCRVRQGCGAKPDWSRFKKDQGEKWKQEVFFHRFWLLNGAKKWSTI